MKPQYRQSSITKFFCIVVMPILCIVSLVGSSLFVASLKTRFEVMEIADKKSSIAIEQQIEELRLEIKYLKHENGQLWADRGNAIAERNQAIADRERFILAWQGEIVPPRELPIPSQKNETSPESSRGISGRNDGEETN